MVASESTITEGLPGVSMDPHAHYALGVSKRTVTRALLTDRRIAFYQRQGRYRQQRPAWRQTEKGRLIWSV